MAIMRREYHNNCIICNIKYNSYNTRSDVCGECKEIIVKNNKEINAFF